MKSPKGFTFLTRDVITELMKAAINPEGVECHWRNEKASTVITPDAIRGLVEDGDGHEPRGIEFA
ncbi:MAG: hypothetical protein E6H06_13520 [Bacteroidetes bacterium]|nr:MAG: hypothetical protein E6H06_13520 [Bacteroidota bacterium]